MKIHTVYFPALMPVDLDWIQVRSKHIMPGGSDMTLDTCQTVVGLTLEGIKL